MCFCERSREFTSFISFDFQLNPFPKLNVMTQRCTGTVQIFKISLPFAVSLLLTIENRDDMSVPTDGAFDRWHVPSLDCKCHHVY